MYGLGSMGGLTMTDRDDTLVQIVTERFERRLAETSGELRVEMADGFGNLRTEMTEGLGTLRTEMAEGFGNLRAEMIERNSELLKWLLVFGVTQTAAVVGIVAAFH